MKACAHVTQCTAKNETTLEVQFHVHLSNGQEFETSAEVGVSPSAAVLNNAIRAKAVAAAAGFGGAGLQTSDVTVFGGVS